MGIFWFLMGMVYVYIGLLALNSCKANVFMPIDSWIGRSLWRGLLVISSWVMVITLVRVRQALR